MASPVVDFFVQLGGGGVAYQMDGGWDRAITGSLDHALDSASGPVRQTLETFKEQIIKHLEDFHSAPWNQQLVNDTDHLQKRSGGLLLEIREGSKVEGTSLDNLLAVNTTGGLSIHETGGEIRPTRSKYLAIPLPSACDRRGVPLHRSPREWPDTFVQTSKKGNLIVFQKQADGSILPLYLLKASVYIRPRLGLEKVWNDWAGSRLEAALIHDLETVFDNLKF